MWFSVIIRIMDKVAENLAGGAPKEFKMPSMEDFQKFIDKMEVSEEEKADLLKAFAGNKDKIFTPEFDPTQAAREAMKRSFFQAGGFSGPNYLYFFITIVILVALLGKNGWRWSRALMSRIIRGTCEVSHINESQVQCRMIKTETHHEQVDEVVACDSAEDEGE